MTLNSFRAPGGRQDDGLRQQDDRETHEVALKPLVGPSVRGSPQRAMTASTGTTPTTGFSTPWL